MGDKGEVLGPDGKAILGLHGELIGSDGKAITGPGGCLIDKNGEPLRGKVRHLDFFSILLYFKIH